MTAKILIVEDEYILALNFAKYLSTIGFNVLCADNGNKAIETAIEFKPDLILMDINLRGDINGIEAATKIKENYNIPVVYISAHLEESILKGAKETESFEYISKPVIEEDLKDKVELVLHKQENIKK